MPRRFVSVEKEISFQGRTERWSNVYCFDMGDVSLSAHEAIQDAVLNAEKPLHRTDVSFKRTRVFTTKGLNGIGDSGDMYSVMERNTPGTATLGTQIPYIECAVLVKWPLTRKTKLGGGLGRQRSLKKWIRGLGTHGMTSSQIGGQVALTAAMKQPFQDYSAAILGIANSDLCSPDDGANPSDAVRIQDYLEHRQFPRGRKEGLI